MPANRGSMRAKSSINALLGFFEFTYGPIGFKSYENQKNGITPEYSYQSYIFSFSKVSGRDRPLTPGATHTSAAESADSLYR